jgi:hypothetical protein
MITPRTRFLQAAKVVFKADEKLIKLRPIFNKLEMIFIEDSLRANNHQMAYEIFAVKDKGQYNGHLRSLFILILLEMYLEDLNQTTNR